jgi:hypothetical protein
MKLEILITFLSLVVAPLAHLMGTTPSKAGLVLMVVPFWDDSEDVAEAAGVRVIGPTRAPFGTLVAVDDVAQFTELKRAGAWFVLDPATSKWICGS